MSKTKNKRNNKGKTKKIGGDFFGNADPYELRDSNIGNSIPLISGASSEKFKKNGPLLFGGVVAVILGFIFIPKALK